MEPVSNEGTDPSALRDAAAAAAGWSVLGELLARAASPISLAVLARLLIPRDFGVVGSAVIIISFSAMVWQAGMPQALVQRQGSDEDLQRAATAAFWVTMLAATSLYLAFAAAAPLLADLFGDTRMTAVIRVQGLQIPIAALSATKAALYQRALDYRTLFAARVLGALLPAIISVPAAWLGAGYWALTAGALAGSVGQTLTIWHSGDWRPNGKPNWAEARDLLGFGGWVGLQSVLGWLTVWADSIVVGTVLGPRDLGLYRTGVTLVTSIFAATLAPLTPVLFSALSRLQDDRKSFHAALRRSTRVAASVALPIGAGLAVTADGIEQHVLGAKWDGVGQVIVAIAAATTLSWLVSLNPPAYNALGRPRVPFAILLTSVIVYVPSYLIGAQGGLSTLLVVRIAVSVAGVSLHLAVAARVLSVGASVFLRLVAAPALATTLMVASTIAVRAVMVPSLAAVVTQVVVGGLIYTAAMRYLAPDIARVVGAQVRRVVFRLDD